MSELVQPALTGSRRRQLEVLEYLYDNPAPTASQEVQFGPLEERLGRDTVQATIPPLIERGHIKSWPSLAGYSGAFLEPSGADVVEEVRAHRDNNAERGMAVRDAILRWLHAQGPGAQPVLSAFLDSSYAEFYGATFTEKDITHGSRWLHEEGYISGSGSLQGGILRPRITPKGTRVVESGRSVNDPQDQAPSQTYLNNFHGATGNVAIGSSNFTQNSTTVNQAADGLAAVVAAAREALDLLTAAGVDRDALTAVLGEAEAVAAAPAEPGMLRTALAKMQTVVATGAGSAVGAILVDRIADLLALIPG